MIATWLLGLLRARTPTLLGTIAGIAVTVGLMASLAGFISASSGEMTARASASVPVDWQVAMLDGTKPDAALAAMTEAAALVATAQVNYANVDGFEAKRDGTVQVTGPGQVVGIEPGYLAAFPGNFRSLLGGLSGTLIAQQTAANLHVGPGDEVTIHRPGAGDTFVKIDAVVDILNADSLFQMVKAIPGAAPTAPPDNVLVLPMSLWHSVFDAQATQRPDSVRWQIHARLDHRRLPPDPQEAFAKVSGAGRNLESRFAGSALLANNLAAVLDTVRADALYARVLFLFLGAPGVVVAILLTFAVAHSGAARRRRDQALVRLRGGTLGLQVQLACGEALLVGLAGSLVGILAAEAVLSLLLGAVALSSTSVPSLLAALGGVVLALAAVLFPAWRDARSLTIAAARMPVGSDDRRLWERTYIDVIVLAAAAIIYWRTAAAGYQIVLAPEGVAAVAVDYWAFLAPLLLWLGGGLLIVRTSYVLLGRAQTRLGPVLVPIAGALAPLIAAFLARQRRRITLGIALTALAFAFGVSTAVFNSTYQAQARVDAELTNGSDVTITGTSAAPAGPVATAILGLPGVAAAERMQHRFAYVGSDLQDLYGIDPTTIGRAATMSNAYFGNDDAAATLAILKNTPDGVLVSEETVSDFQLALGDTINLRLQSATDHQYRAVPFHFVGIVREFPTAPHDSFLIANADYIARVTGSAAAEILLIRVNTDPQAVAASARNVVAALPGVEVQDIGAARQLISSSLTAVDLFGLTRLELAFALALVAAAAGLVLALGAFERRYTFAVLTALGARPVQLRAFLWSEGLLILFAGIIGGVIVGTLVSVMLVKLLTGVFDPPPDGLSVPWSYLAFLGITSVAALIAAVRWTAPYAAASVGERLRIGN